VNVSSFLYILIEYHSTTRRFGQGDRFTKIPNLCQSNGSEPSKGKLMWIIFTIGVDRNYAVLYVTPPWATGYPAGWLRC